jgi:tRNA(His) 5'-end guanylyltransferase
MFQTTKALMEETRAIIGYTQSDEITLVIIPNDQPTFFGQRVQKLCSILASLASVVFLEQVRQRLPEEYAKKRPLFDCRVWTVPNLEEAANAIQWRQMDGIRNSISSLARTWFSAKQLFMKNSQEMKTMLLGQGVNWDTLDYSFKYGMFLKRHRVMKPFQNVADLPEKHHARTNPNLVVQRHKICECIYPQPLEKLENKVKLLFDEHEAPPLY